MSVPQPPPVDTGNQLLAETPSQLSASLVETAAGQRLALTVRTTSATVTVLLGGKDAKEWAATLTAAAVQMSSSGLAVANGRLRQQ